MTIYRVKGVLNYRGHTPGTVFIATIPRDEEARALTRGNIEIIQRGTVTIEKHRVRTPKG